MRHFPNPPKDAFHRTEKRRLRPEAARREKRRESRAAGLRRLRLARKSASAPDLPDGWRGMAWYLLVVKAGHEVGTARALGEAGFAGFCAAEVVLAKVGARAPRMRELWRPCIASLCLVGFQPGGEQWGRILGRDGVRDERLASVIGSIGADGEPERLRRNVVEWFVAHHGAKAETRAGEARARRIAELKALIGHEVEIVGGLFERFEGVVETFGAEGFGVRIPVLGGHGALARVPEEWIRALSA